MNIKSLLSVVVTISIVTLFSCGGASSENTANQNSVVISHELSDAQMLNPVNYSDAGAGYILANMFYTLLAIDFETLELTPVVAKNRPEIELIEGGMLITYEIRPVAKWDNGEQITPKDVEFALKVIKNPKVDNLNNKPYYEFIRDIKFYDDNPLKFTFICKDVYILAEAQSGDMPLLPRSIYDPKGLMEEFSIKQLTEEADKLAQNEKIIAFATDFNSEKYQRDANFIQGCGPYLLKEWQTGQKLTIIKKENWWGDNLKALGGYFDVNPPEIIYQTINDQTTAKEALIAGKIDVMRGIKAKDYKEVLANKKYNDNYNSHTPSQMAYSYLGINVRKPIFSDKRTRQAIAHLVDVDKIIEKISLGYAERAIGPIHPSSKKHYNNNIKLYDFNPEKAKQLLAEVGWKDSDGDGVLDNIINGKKVKMEFNYLYNQGNDDRKAVGLMLQEEARKVGITITVLSQDWSIFIESTKQHNFDMYFGGWISTPIPADHKQIYHTSSYNGGSNYTGFGNNETDALIDSIRITIDEDKRAEMNRRFQQILHDECSYIFLTNPLERIGIHKRFSNANTSVMRPGYQVTRFLTGKQLAQ